MTRFTAAFLFACWAACAQQPPVVLIDGYHLTCSSVNLTSTATFADLEAKLTAQGFSVIYFPTCSLPGKPPIEELGAAFGAKIAALPAPQVDVITHSMGGLVLRSYLAGKGTVSGAFNPPPNPKVRKWISIATPNFGTLFSDLLGSFVPDGQVKELLPSSQFLFDLATWNQHRDDLRRIDAMAIAGNAADVGLLNNQSDGLVPTTSASLSFAEPDERTRVIPYCHTDDDLTVLLGGGCGKPPIAKIVTDDHLSYRIIRSFLADTGEWKTIGISPSQDPVLAKFGGELIQNRDKSDANTGSIQNRDFVQAPVPGTYTAEIVKPGPFINRVLPSAGLVDTLNVAPRELVSIYGVSLDSPQVTLNGQPLQVLYSGPNQVNALLPEGVSGLQVLTITNAAGKSSTNLLVEDEVPAIFTFNGSGTGAAAAIRTGNYISLYLTGLGANRQTVAVTVDGLNATVTYAGQAPGFPGLDQINIQIPAGARTGTPVPVQVAVPGHTSNTVTLTL